VETPLPCRNSCHHSVYTRGGRMGRRKPMRYGQSERAISDRRLEFVHLRSWPTPPPRSHLSIIRAAQAVILAPNESSRPTEISIVVDDRPLLFSQHMAKGRIE